MKTRTERQLELEWKRGFACAVATFIRTHGCRTEAADVLKCGCSDLRGIDQYDREVLRPVAAEIKRRRAAKV